VLERHTAAGQLGTRLRRRRRFLDELDDLVDVGQGHREPLQHVRPLARLAQLVHRAPGDHFAAVTQEGLQQLLQVQHARLAIHQGHHVHAEGILHLRFFVQIVQDHFRDLAALQLDHHPHARLVGLVADLGDAFQPLLAHQLADARQEIRLVDLVGQLVRDDGLALPLVQALDMGAGAQDHAPAAGPVAFPYSSHPVDDPVGRKVGARDDLHQFVDVGIGLLEQPQARVHHLAEVVRRDVGRHPYRNTGGPVDQQVRDLAGQDRRLLLLTVVVGDEVDGFLVDVRQQLASDALQPALGVAISRRVVAVHRPEVALPVDQRVAHGEVLGHAHQGFIGGGVAVRVIFPEHVPDHAGTFHIWTVPHVVRLVHGEQHAAVDRLEPVADIGQRPAYDHAHRVVEIGTPHLLFEADGQGFFGDLVHGSETDREAAAPAGSNAALGTTGLPRGQPTFLYSGRRKNCKFSMQGLPGDARRPPPRGLGSPGWPPFPVPNEPFVLSFDGLQSRLLEPLRNSRDEKKKPVVRKRDPRGQPEPETHRASSRSDHAFPTQADDNPRYRPHGPASSCRIRG
jgi:hypothetical protein